MLILSRSETPLYFTDFFQTAALHGNELNGIPLTHRLVLQEIQCQALHGIVVAVPVANVPGYLAQQRGFSDGTDLNRLMPGYGFFFPVHSPATAINAPLETTNACYS